MSSPPAERIPEIDPDLYRWNLHPTVPRLYQRRALGPETKWARQPSATRQLYLTGQITFLSSDNSMNLFFQAAEKAWFRLRFEHPEVVQNHTGDFNADGSAIMQCEIPRHERVVKDWVKRTFLLGIEGPHAGGVASVEVEMRGKEITTDPVSVLWHATYSKPEIPGIRRRRLNLENLPQFIGAAFCLKVDHGLADGIGAYVLAGKYLKLVGEELGGRAAETMKWAKAVDNLPKAWVRMVNKEQKTGGEEFEKDVRALTELMTESLKTKWGLDVQAEDGYRPMSIHQSFSPEKSNALLRSVKEKLGPDSSITYLGHAAMVLTMLRLKPPRDRPSDQNRIVSPVFANGRKYLEIEQPKSANHVPMCRAMNAVEFCDVEKIVISNGSSHEETQQKLKRACEEARRSYQRIRKKNSLLTESFFVAETMVTAWNEVDNKGMSDPVFLSDGIIEQYTPRLYTDFTTSKEIFTLDDIRFTANPDGPPLIIRMSTFKDAIRLSAEWNAVCYAEDSIRRFLDSVVELMMSWTHDPEEPHEAHTKKAASES